MELPLIVIAYCMARCRTVHPRAARPFRRRRPRDRGEVSATTVVLAAALIALAIAVGVIITSRVQDKANTINLG